MSELHVVLGAGQIGPRLVDLLLERGHRVRVVRRGKDVVRRSNVELAAGDVRDLGFAEEATRGAAVVYDCMNPSYHQWPELLLPIARGAVHGATKAGAKLVALDCLYMYGRAKGPMREDSPLTPCSKKGVLRVELAAMRQEAHRRGDLRVAIARASDFIGEDLQQSFWGDRFFARILAGRAGECLGDPDMPHAYTYAGDVARALATLGARAEADGKVWHVPTPPAETTRQIACRFGRALGVDADVKRIPRAVLTALGWFSPILREAREMAYQWEAPFVLDDARFRTTFGWSATPMDAVVARTAAWAAQRFGIVPSVTPQAA